MSRLLSLFALTALLASPAPSLAQVAPDIKAKAPADFLPGSAIFCSSDAGTTWSPCSSASGGGGGSSSPSATNGSAAPSTIVPIAGADNGGVARTVRTSASGQVAVADGDSRSDGLANTGASLVNGTGSARLPLYNLPWVFNGTTWDRARGDTEGAYVKQADLKAVTFTSGTASGNILLQADTSGYQGLSVQLTGTWVATVAWEGSNDNANWNTITGLTAANGTGSTTTSSNNVFYIPPTARYVRARVSAYTSGTVSGSAFLRAGPPLQQTAGIAISSITGSTAAGTNAMGGVSLLNSLSPNGSQTVHMRTSTADTNSASVKGSGCKIVGGRLRNKGASEVVFKLYNRTTAPNVGTDTIYLKIPVPAGQTVNLVEILGPAGMYLGTGCAYGVSALEADNDNTAVGAGDLFISLIYL